MAIGTELVTDAVAAEASIQEMVRRIVSRFNPDRIILFGSRARGSHAPDSDVDLAVIMPIDGSKAKREIEIRLLLHDIPIPKDIVVITPEEMDRYRDVPGTLVKPVLRDGRLLYARA